MPRIRGICPIHPLRIRMLLCATFAALALGGAACASGGGGGGGGGGSSRNLISTEELRELPPMDALQAIRRLRGRWLQVRNAGAPSVHIDGRFTGNLTVLEEYRIDEIREIRYRSAAEATTLYGTNYPAGVIEIRTGRE